MAAAVLPRGVEVGLGSPQSQESAPLHLAPAILQRYGFVMSVTLEVRLGVIQAVRIAPQDMRPPFHLDLKVAVHGQHVLALAMRRLRALPV